MIARHRLAATFLFVFALSAAVSPAKALRPEASGPTPEAFFGFRMGEEGRLASWTAMVEYLRHLDEASPRVLVQEAGRTTGGHPYLTLRVLRSLAESPPKEWTADSVDGRLHELFLGTAGESDTNLQFTRDPAGVNVVSQAIAMSSIGGLSLTGGTGSDNFLVTPSTSAIINVNGNLPDPAATPGDVLDLNLTSRLQGRQRGS